MSTFSQGMRHSISAKKVTILVTDGNVGGVQSFLLARFRNFDPNSFRIIALSDGKCCEEFRRRGVETHVFGRIELLLKGPAYFSRERTRLAICNSSEMGVYGRLLSAIGSVNAIYITHGWGASYSRSPIREIAILAEKLLAKISFRIWCVSKRDLEFAQGTLGIPTAKLRLLKSAKFSYQPRKAPIRKICVVMRDAPPKRYDLVERLAGIFPSITFHCYGASRESLENCIYHGVVDEVPYQGFDAAMLLSDSEGYPLAAVEAASFDLPVFMLDIPVVTELIYNGIQVWTLDEKSLQDSFETRLREAKKLPTC